MTAEQFQKWLQAMFQSNKARTNIEVSILLGRKPNQISLYKRRGANRTVALACAALLRGIKPYGEKLWTEIETDDPGAPMTRSMRIGEVRQT